VVPFVPKSNAKLEPGHFWSIPLSDRRFACGRVLAIDRAATYGSRSSMIAGLLDWVGDAPPTGDAIAGRPLLESGHLHVRSIGETGGTVLGHRPLELDGIIPPPRVPAYWGYKFPAMRAEAVFVDGKRERAPKAERRILRAPLTDEQLRPSPTGRGAVQFSTMLTDAEFERLAAWLRDYPEMTLRAYGSYDGSIRDLEFLRFFPTLRRFDVDSVWSHLRSLDGLRHLPDDVEQLALGATKRGLDLRILDRFGGLRTLFLEGHTNGIDVVSRLTRLEALSLRSITLPDLSVLLPLQLLRSFELKLGGTKNLALLPRIGQLRYLEIWLVRGLSDLSAIGDLPELRYLFLQALKQVRSLPSLERSRMLRRVHLETMQGLTDLAGVARAPALEELVLVDMAQLEPESLAPFRGHPALRKVAYGFGSVRKSKAAEAFLGLPDVNAAFAWRPGELR